MSAHERRANRTTAMFQEYSDDESAATDSIAESDPEETYTVEKILLERESESEPGQFEYLLKWQGYALDRATWEPRDHIESGTLLRDWQKQKRLVKNGLAEAFDEDLWLEAMQQAGEKTKLRREKREEKRRRRAAKSLFVERENAPKRRHLTKRVAHSSGSEDYDQSYAPVQRQPASSDHGSPTRKPPAAPKPPPSPSQPRSNVIPNTTAVPSTNPPVKKGTASPVKRNVTPLTPTAPIVKPVAAPAKAVTPANITKAVPPLVKSATTPAQRVTAESSNANTAGRNTAPISSDKSTAPVVAARKSAPTVPIRKNSESTSTATKFNTLSFQHRMQRNGQNEPPPDPPKLIFVDLKTGRAQIPNAYRRRSPQPERRPPSPSPEPEQEPEPELEPQSAEVSANSGLPVVYDHRIFMTCGQWRNCRDNSCVYSHGDVPKKKDFVCFFWLTSRCNRPSHACDFAHHDTGKYVRGPRGTSNVDIVPHITAMKEKENENDGPSNIPSHIPSHIPSQDPPHGPRNGPSYTNLPRLVAASGHGKDATCFYWSTGNCNKTECRFAHSPKMMFCRPPPTYQGSVDMSAVIASFFPRPDLEDRTIKPADADRPRPPSSIFETGTNSRRHGNAYGAPERPSDELYEGRRFSDIAASARTSDAEPRRNSIGGGASTDTISPVRATDPRLRRGSASQNAGLHERRNTTGGYEKQPITERPPMTEISKSQCESLTALSVASPPTAIMSLPRPAEVIDPRPRPVDLIDKKSSLEDDFTRADSPMCGTQLTLITDELFIRQPEHATEIINTCLNEYGNKIATRPNLKLFILNLMDKKTHDPAFTNDEARKYEDLYLAAFKLHHPNSENLLEASDKICDPGWPHYADMWDLDHSVATQALVEWFASFSAEQKQDGWFDLLRVCHTTETGDEKGSDESRKWKEKFPHLTFPVPGAVN